MASKYPAILTNKEWQKKKGLFAKAKPTGIGEKLVVLEKLYNGSAFVSVDPAGLGKETKDPLLFEKRLNSLTKTLSAQAAKIDAAAAQADATIKTAMPAFAKDKSVSKYLETLVIALKGLRSDIRAGSGDHAAFLAAVKTSYKAHLKEGFAFSAFEDAARSGEKKWSEAMEMIKKVEATKQLSAIHDAWGVDGPHRSITTFCKIWDQYAPQFPELTKSVFAGKAMDAYAGLPWMKAVANETNRDASKRVEEYMKQLPEDRAVVKMTMEYSSSMLKSHEIIKHINDVWKVLAKAAT